MIGCYSIYINSFYNDEKYVVGDNNKIILNKYSLNMIVGSSENLSVISLPDGVRVDDIIWKSTNEAVATVDASGKVTGISEGSASIMAIIKNNNSIRSICVVTVSKGSVVVPITDLKISRSSMKLKVGASGRLKFTVVPSNATNKKVNWSSSAPDVVSVNEKGIISALKVGSATITVFSQDNPNIKSSCVINVKNNVIPVKKLKINKVPKVMYYGETYDLKVKISPSNATDKSLIYQSSNSSVVSVDKNGRIKILMNINSSTFISVYSSENSNIKKTIKIITRVKLKKLGVVSPIGNIVEIKPKEDKIDKDVFGPQGFCVARYKNEKYLLTSMISKDETKGTIRVYKRKERKNGAGYMELINKFTKGSSFFEHAGDMAYIPENNKVYVSASSTKGTRVFNLSNSLKGGTPSFETVFFYNNENKKQSGGGVAYDIVSKRFFYAKGSYYYFGGNQMNIGDKFLKADGEYTIDGKIKSYPQGISAYNNKLLMVRYNPDVKENDSTIGKPRNAIDVYDGKTGEYIGTNIIKVGTDKSELEGVDYYGNDNFAIYYYIKGTGISYVKKVKLNLE